MLSQVWWVWWPIWGIVVYSQCGLITVLDVGVPCLPGGVVWCILTEVSARLLSIKMPCPDVRSLGGCPCSLCPWLASVFARTLAASSLKS